MRLTAEERAWLAGEGGPALQRAMRIVAALGRIYGAQRLVPVASVQVAGVAYRNLGEAGLAFLRDWAAEGARVRVPTTLNPAGMDLVDWRRQGFSAREADLQAQVVAAYEAMGVSPTCTCTPYLVGYRPGRGEHLAWSESSAVAFANSVLGARTNREGGPSALAAAVVGRTAAYGLHLDANRCATHRVRVRCRVQAPHEYAALGYMVGRVVGAGVPAFEGLPTDGQPPDDDRLKLLGAALASSGAVALFHVAGVTPEARDRAADLYADRVEELAVGSLAEGLAALNGPEQGIDLVVIGCPHASLAEVEAVAQGLRGRRARAALWVTTSRQVREAAAIRGLVAAIEDAGGLVVADGCVVVAPMSDLPYRTLATNSAKMAAYALPHAGLRVRFGSLEACLDAAVSGVWR